MEVHYATVFESLADLIGERAALVQGGRTVSWAEFDDRAARLAGAFAAAGVGRDSKVAQFLYNAPAYLESWYAALKIRAIPVNVNYRYLDEELLYLLDNSDSQVLLFHSTLGDRVARIKDRATKVKLFIEVGEAPDGSGPVTVDGAVAYSEVLAGAEPAPRIERSADDHTMIYTGGTTGMPKGVLSKVGPTLKAIMTTTPPLLGLAPIEDPAEIAALAKGVLDGGNESRSLPACPLMHGTGLGLGALPALALGGAVVLLEGTGLDAPGLWDTVEKERVTTLTIVGDAFARPLLRALQDGGPRDLSGLQIIVSAGAMFSLEIREAILEHIPQAMIIDFIAATEGAMGTAFSMKGAVAPTGRFVPMPGVTVIGEDDRPVAPGSGERGMVAVPGDIPDGYYKDSEKTDKTFRIIDGVRYSLPGDFATIEADGQITLLGRGSQCINTGGEKVFPEEVEETIKRHPDIDDCLIFGIPDERFGQRVVGVASVTRGHEVEAADVITASRDLLSAYKLPRQLVLVPDVPRAPNGKADYPSAKALFAAATEPA